MELWQLLGDLHPKLVQIPLVLLLLGLVFDAGGLVGRSARAHWAAMCATGAGTVGLLFAFICGIYAEIWAGRAGVPQHPIELHELMANFASWGFVLLLAWRLFLRPEQRRAMGAYLAVGFCWYFLLGVTAWLGGQLVFQYGAAVTGAHANTVLTLEDLNTLATRQTDENLRYSEWMHHIFGWMTLGLAASLLAQALFPKHRGKVKWIVPTCLLAGGIFLFFFADLDLYRFTDPRQWRDREVMLHKSLALIMATIGVVGLVKTFRHWGEAVGEKAKRPSQSTWVAVLALIGGAMLFTHVHTVAPYANVAAGVYVAHVVMGLVALSIGATRLAQDYLPGWKRGLAVSFAVFMGVESVLLLTYNEGLPWYIGYGRYNRWGPVQTAEYTVAPYGDVRAVMHVDTATGRVVVDVVNRFTEEPATVATDVPLELLVSQGYRETAIPLTASVGGAAPGRYVAHGVMHDVRASHFEGEADFFKTIPAFSARLALPLNGRMVMGYFDPWVTPVVAAIPPNEVAGYFCPMHEGIRTVVSGNCRLCGMEMLPLSKAIREPGQLHDAHYVMEFTCERNGPADGTPLRFLLKKADGTPAPLAPVHEHLLHLIVVSESLDYFDHVHPVMGTDGALTLTYRFPRAGRYLLYADMTPKGDRSQVFRLPVEVTAERVVRRNEDVAVGNQLVDDVAGGKLVRPIKVGTTPQDSAAWVESGAGDGTTVQVELVKQPRNLLAGLHANLLFRISDAQGRPVTDLVKYIGAMGHCVILSEDTREYLHCHPEQLLTPGVDEKGGPVIAFHAVFPRAGRYRVWGQFRRGDDLIVAAFTVDVGEPLVPASVLKVLLGE